MQGSDAVNWALDPSGYLPFAGWSRNVTSVVTEDAITNRAGADVFSQAYVTTKFGVSNNLVQQIWQEACKERVIVTTRMDNPF